MPSLIRRATHSDLPFILSLNQALFQKEYQEFDKTLDLEWVERDGEKYFQDHIDSQGSFVNVAAIDNKIIGYLCGMLTSTTSGRKEGIYAEAANMLVLEEYRGHGIGNKLMDQFFEWCKEKNVNIVSVLASFDNKEAIGFYKKLGFEGYGVALEKIIKDL